MADRILVSTPEMEATIQKYESARQELQDAYSKLDAAKQHLDNCYKGPAYVALSAKWVDIYMNVRTADNAIDASVNGLRQTISMMGEQGKHSEIARQSGDRQERAHLSLIRSDTVKKETGFGNV